MELKKTFFATAETLGNNSWSWFGNGLSSLKCLILDDVEAAVFCETLHINSSVKQQFCQNFTLLDAAGISPAVFLKQDAKANERESWVAFKTGTSKVENAVHTDTCSLWFFA